jgi:hypothetical protein
MAVAYWAAVLCEWHDHPDGLELSVDPALLDDAVRIKVESVARLNFLSEAVPDEWHDAAVALPAHLVLKGPVFGIAVEATADIPVRSVVVGAQPDRSAC